MRAIRANTQRGAVMPLVAVCLIALTLSMLLVLDTGRLLLAQRSLQKSANLAAMDAARAIGSCQGEPADVVAAARTAAHDSLTRNQADPSLLDNAGSSVTLGQVTESGAEYGFAPTAEDEASAVRVVLSRPAPTRLSTLWGNGATPTLVAAAAAYSTPTVGLSTTSGLLDLDLTASPLLGPLLSGLLGIPPGQLTVSVLDLQGVANVDVTLLQLIEAGVGAGNVGDFLSTPISAAGFLSQLGDVVSEIDSVVAGPLLAELASLTDPGLMVLPSDFIAVAPDAYAQAATMPINAAQILMSLAQTTGKGEPIQLPVALNLPGIASANATVKLTEAAIIALGRPGYYLDDTPRTAAYSAQGLVQLDLNLSPTIITNLLNVLTLGLVNLSATVELHLYAKLAEARAVPAELFCATVDQPHPLLDMDITTGIASLGLGQFDDIESPNPQPQAAPPVVDLSISLLFGLIPVADVEVSASAGPIDVGSNSPTRVAFDGPFVPILDRPSVTNTQTVSTDLGGALNGTLQDLSSTLQLDTEIAILGLGLPTNLLNNIVNALLSSLTGLLSPILTGLDEALLQPLFTLLGLDLGTGTVTVTGVYPSQPDRHWGGYRPVVVLTESE